MIDVDLLVLAVRDGVLPELACALAAGPSVSARTAVIHVAGALGPEVLAPLRDCSAGVAQAHPMLSFASKHVVPRLTGGHLLVSGDAVAVRRARRLARVLGMVARSWIDVDRAMYHAAAGLLANGAAALAGASAELLELAGCPIQDTGRVLAPLLRSVADNLQSLGLPAALTGPVRRGDAETVLRHMAAIERAMPQILPLYRESVSAQLSMALALGDASRQKLAELAERAGIAPATRAKAPKNPARIAARSRGR
jgi:predicted short-subunit dehydrogenase-like oxidoreductase (DUF2520 family)